jgi:hypothetical protein
MALTRVWAGCPGAGNRLRGEGAGRGRGKDNLEPVAGIKPESRLSHLVIDGDIALGDKFLNMSPGQLSKFIAEIFVQTDPRLISDEIIYLIHTSWLRGAENKQ